MVVVSFVAIIFDISIVGLEIYISNIGVGLFCPFSSIATLVTLTLKVVPEGRVLVKCNSFEFPIRIEAKDKGKEIVSKADNRHSIDKLLLPCVSTRTNLILNRRHKVNHKWHSKEYANEDVEHDTLIAALMLDNV